MKSAFHICGLRQAIVAWSCVCLLKTLRFDNMQKGAEIEKTCGNWQKVLNSVDELIIGK